MPVWSLLLIGAAALAISVAQIPHNIIATVGLLAAGVVLVGAIRDRRLADACSGIAAQRIWSRAR